MARKATFSSRAMRLPTINAVPESIEEPVVESPGPGPEPDPLPEPEPMPEPEPEPPMDGGALVRVVVSRELVRADLREHSPVGACVAEIRLAPGWTMGALLDHLKQHYCVAQ